MTARELKLNVGLLHQDTNLFIFSFLARQQEDRDSSPVDKVNQSSPLGHVGEPSFKLKRLVRSNKVELVAVAALTIQM